MRAIILSLSQENPLVELIAKANHYEIGELILHHFPDDESYLQIKTDLKGREVIVLCSLDRPNPKILPLLFVAESARAMGAKQVGLCVPYLAYMRQDKQFHPGEAVTSTYFATLLSNYFDWLVTIDPHLHRRHALDEIYTIPNTVLHAAPEIATWIASNVEQPILVGPDKESEQWVREVASGANAPYLILEKNRYGDREVEVSIPETEAYPEHTPVLVDDIISTARTMIATIHHLKKLNMKPAVCIGIHAVFAENAYEALIEAGAAQIVTCNTILHRSNAIDLSTRLAEGIQGHQA